MGSLRINLPFFIFHHPSIKQLLFLFCRPFVVITTFSTGLVGVEVTSVSWFGQKQQLFDGRTVENKKGKIILTEIFTSVQKHDI